MRLHFLKDFDGHKRGENKFVELSLGRRYVENGIAITYQQHLDNLYEEELARQEQEKKKAELLKKKETAKPKRATSKRATTRKKATKPGA